MKVGKARKNVFNKIFVILAAIVLASVGIVLTQRPEKNVVVVYVSHDQDLSEPILKRFESATGVKVLALYDTEATKTVGLVNRIIAEKDNPQADVFWNNEPMRTVKLKDLGLLEPYCSVNGADIPENFKDKDCYWFGFAARARVIIYNTNLIRKEEAPKSIYDFIDPKWKGKACIANPLLGSTSTHVALLFAFLGEEEAKELLKKMKENEVKIVESNSMVRDMVVAGECWFGLTDTDDAFDAIAEGKPVEMVFPDQQTFGTMVFPNTVAIIRNAKHRENAEKLVDFLLSSEVEEELAKTALQIPVKSSSKAPEEIKKFGLDNIKPVNISWSDVYNNLDKSLSFLKESFLK